MKLLPNRPAAGLPESAAALRDALEKVRKPAALQLAERSTCRAREARAAADLERRDALAEMRVADRIDAKRINKLNAKVDETQSAVRSAHDALHVAQQAFSPDFLAKISGPTAAAKAELAAHLDAISEIAETLVAVKRFADGNNLAAPKLVMLSRHVRAHLTALRRYIGK